MRLPFAILVLLTLPLAGCGGDRADAPASGRAASGAAELTAFELEHGIGPFTEPIALGPVDPALVELGRDVFEMNCAVCHDMDTRLVGPPLGDVTERRSPLFIMNIIMNPEEMVRRHPEGQAMLAQYPLVMPYQNISEEEARAILEYLRTVE